MDSIRLILQGGGTKCAYQLSFLNKLIKNDLFNKKYNIEKIYGTSFGALVGYFVCINRIDILDNFFKSLDENSLRPIFNFWGINFIKKIPFIGKFFNYIFNIFWLLMGLKYKGLFDQDFNTNVLFDFDLNDEQKKKLNKYYCCVYNITKQQTEYINGSHPLIREYIIASSSLWIIFKPRVIRQLKTECICDKSCDCSNENKDIFCTCSNLNHQLNEIMDGGLLKPIPIEFETGYNGKYLIMTTKDINQVSDKKFLFDNSGKNLFDYLDKIITFLNEYNQYLDINFINKDWHKLSNVFLINYISKYNDPAILKKEIINEYIQDGENLANNFIINLKN